jgi:hypothetical protein
MSGKISDNLGRSSGLVKAGAGGVPSIAGDKSNPELGDMWYNSSTSKLRCYLTAPGAFSVGGDLATDRNGAYGCGTASAAFVAGGFATSTSTNSSEEYNGTAWSSGGNVPLDVTTLVADGTLTSNMAVGGYSYGATAYQTKAYSYNGTGWTTETDMPSATCNAGHMGTSSTDFATCGGWNGVAEVNLDDIKLWNGTSWSDPGNDLSRTVRHCNGCGPSTISGMIVAGTPGGTTFYDETEIYNGTSWSAGPVYPQETAQLGGGGTPTDAYFIGGHPAAVTTQDDMHFYNGTSWSTETVYPHNAESIGASCKGTTGDFSAFGGGSRSGGSGGYVYQDDTYEWLSGPQNTTISTE